MRPNWRRPDAAGRVPSAGSSFVYNLLIFNQYFLVTLVDNWLLQINPARSYMARNAGGDLIFFDFVQRKWRSPASIVRVFFAIASARTRDGAGPGLNQTHRDDTKASMWRDFSGLRTSI
jgi:hypothetical protein